MVDTSELIISDPKRFRGTIGFGGSLVLSYNRYVMCNTKAAFREQDSTLSILYLLDKLDVRFNSIGWDAIQVYVRKHSG